MVEKKTTSRVLIGGRVEWFARRTINGRWHQTGLYHGIEHTMVIPKQITPRSAAFLSRKLIEENRT